MKTATRAVLPLALILATSCASHPGDIAPAVVSNRDYVNLTCDGLQDALAEAQANLAAASSRQKTKRTVDGVGNALLIPGLLSLVRDSREAVARHKGEVVTITRELDSREDC